LPEALITVFISASAVKSVLIWQFQSHKEGGGNQSKQNTEGAMCEKFDSDQLRK